MTDTDRKIDKELSAMQSLFSILESLDTNARSRVINYSIVRLEIDLQGTAGFQTDGRITPIAKGHEDATTNDVSLVQEYATFAELYDATQPKSNSGKALVAGYWLQVCQHAENFGSQSANKDLKNLGHGIPNITAAMNVLIKSEPSLALQLRKSGKSRQSRKLYKVTATGIRAVENMIHE